MSVYKRKGSPFWWYGFQADGRRFQGSTGEASRENAETVERAIRGNIGKHRLYRHYAHDNRLLHLSVSDEASWARHPWVKEVAVIVVEHFQTSEEAQSAKATAILAEGPLYHDPL